jgi:hypothetical protein
VKKKHCYERDEEEAAGSYLKLFDSCTTQLEAKGPSRICNQSEEEV